MNKKIGTGIPELINKDYKRIEWDEYFLNVAFEIAKRSHDSQTQHGAVFVRDNRIICCGFNGYPSGSPDDILPNQRGPDNNPAKLDFINHAEESAMLQAARTGPPLIGCTLYCTGIPCARCTRLLVSVGVMDWVVGGRGHVSSEKDKMLRDFWIDHFTININQYDRKI